MQVGIAEVDCCAARLVISEHVGVRAVVLCKDREQSEVMMIDRERDALKYE